MCCTPLLLSFFQRPIAEFSLENRKALETKQKRLEKSKVSVIH